MIEFTEAKRENVSLLISIAGPSGCGKTKSALRMAQGISPAGKVAFIDTESRRALHYATEFKFTHYDMRPPFPPARFIEAIKAAEQTGAEVLVIDSFSHEYAGEGGITDMADALERSGTKSPGNWREPKSAHKKLINAILQARLSIIFCLRADEKIRIGKDANGRTVVEPLGWMPICEKRFPYEMTASFTLTADHPGRPNYSLPHKVQDQHRAFFPDGELIGEEAGRKLAAWARGDAAPAASVLPAADLLALIAEGDLAASFESLAPLEAFWSARSKDEKRAIGPDKLAAWKASVAENVAAGERADGEAA